MHVVELLVRPSVFHVSRFFAATVKKFCHCAGLHHRRNQGSMASQVTPRSTLSLVWTVQKGARS